MSGDDDSYFDEPRDSNNSPADHHFERIDWEAIDSDQRARSRREIAWVVFVAIWSGGVMIDLWARYIADQGPASFPILGEVSAVGWLWSITLVIVFFYGVLPLYEHQRMTKQYWNEFKKNKAAVVSGIYLVIIFIIGVVGARIVPAPESNPRFDNQPPAWMSVDEFVVTQCVGEVRNGACHGTWQHPFGTTPSGEDIFAGVIHGMEVSMQVGLIATLISLTIGATVALTAAYYGGIVDELLMRYVDIQLTFPTFFLYLLFAYTIGGNLFVLILIFGFLGWGGAARIMRAEALQRREETYMMAAKSAGASSRYTIRRHLLPNISNSIITAASLAIPGIILAEAAIAFLGLGDPTVPSWGRLIADGREWLRNAWWISTIPGIFLFFTVLAFNFLGDALRDALDPRHGGNDR